MVDTCKMCRSSQRICSVKNVFFFPRSETNICALLSSSEQIIFPGVSQSFQKALNFCLRTDHFSRKLQYWQKVLNFCPEHVFYANHWAYKCSEQIIFAEGCPISRGNYFTEHVFRHFTEQIEQNFFEQISFTGSFKKQLVQPKLSVRTDLFHRMTNFWISLKTGTEQIVFPGEKQATNTFFTEQIRWLLSNV